ncbi:SLAM family member 9 [Engraulis encrasicolus]|uniref:SLAM family member 9 n=1 Tax=Engraulis encrasicolus TaxID=184585 RepID=UPI002FD15C6F
MVMFLVAIFHLFGTLRCHSEPVHIIAYEGESVTLPSGRNSSWNLSRIQWSIFNNITFIATLRSGERNTNHFERYRGRLTLDTTTGDLHMSGLRGDDSRLYSVLLMAGDGQENHEVNLEVREQLPVPHLTIKVATVHDGHCRAEVRCDPQRAGLSISWQSTNSTTKYYQRLDGNDSVLYAEVQEYSTGNFTCFLSDGLRHEKNITEGTCQLKDRHHHYLTACLLSLGPGLIFLVYRLQKISGGYSTS